MLAVTKMSEKIAARTGIFGLTGTIIVTFSGLFKVVVLENHFEELRSNPKTVNWLTIYLFFYLTSGLWSFEDFRITLFVKSPLYAVLQWKLVSFRKQIASYEVTDQNDSLYGIVILFVVVSSYIRNLDIT